MKQQHPVGLGDLSANGEIRLQLHFQTILRQVVGQLDIVPGGNGVGNQPHGPLRTAGMDQFTGNHLLAAILVQFRQNAVVAVDHFGPGIHFAMGWNGSMHQTRSRSPHSRHLSEQLVPQAAWKILE